jgi:hypothetical protein
MARMRVIVVAAGIALVLAGCSTAAGQVRKRASSDFGCPEDDVWVDALRPGYVARGCRKEADYDVHDGLVTRTSQVRPTGETRPPLPIDRIPDTNSVGLD